MTSQVYKKRRFTFGIWKLRLIQCGWKIQENMDMDLVGDLVCFPSAWSRSPRVERSNKGQKERHSLESFCRV